MTESQRKKLKQELLWQKAAKNEECDIFFIVHNQPELTKDCLKSIESSTTHYKLHIWDNSSNKKTSNILKRTNFSSLIKTQENKGFIFPNNYLYKITFSPYIILLNNDTIVSPGWKEALLGCLQNTTYSAVGFEPCKIGKNFIGYPSSCEDFDYLSGSCLCLKRECIGDTLFDENLHFAYGEDSDLCLRLKKNLYCLSLKYFKHFGSRTISEVSKKIDTSTTFNNNHKYLVEKWRIH